MTIRGLLRPASFLTTVGIASAAAAWTTTLESETTPQFWLPNQAPRDLALHGSGDPVAAGGLKTLSGVAFTVVRIDAATGLELWRHEVQPFEFLNSAASVGVDSAGHVLASGRIEGPDGSDLAAVKLDGESGTPLWSVLLTGVGDPSYDQAFDGAVGASGDLYVAGELQRATPEGARDFAVARLDGSTGTEQWRSLLTGDPDSGGFAQKIELDAAGDVVVAGVALGAVFGEHVALVAKLDGATGAELWRRTLSHASSTGGVARVAGLALDAAGNVLVAPHPSSQATQFDLSVAKLDADTGEVLWRHDVDGPTGGYDYAHGFAIDTQGDVIVVGEIDAALDAGSGSDFVVLKLDSGDGDELWRLTLDEDGEPGSARAVALLPTGDVAAVGTLTSEEGRDWVVVRVDGSNGKELCRGAVDVGPTFSGALGTHAAVDASGHVVSLGTWDDLGEIEQLSVAKRRGATCADFVVASVPALPAAWAVLLALVLAGVGSRLAQA